MDSTGNYIQYPVINHNSKEYEKECIYMYVYLNHFSVQQKSTQYCLFVCFVLFLFLFLFCWVFFVCFCFCFFFEKSTQYCKSTLLQFKKKATKKKLYPSAMAALETGVLSLTMFLRDLASRASTAGSCSAFTEGVPAVAQWVKDPTQCPLGFWFDPWPCSVG